MWWLGVISHSFIYLLCSYKGHSSSYCYLKMTTIKARIAKTHQLIKENEKLLELMKHRLQSVNQQLNRNKDETHLQNSHKGGNPN